jgi:hypothetical protein
MARFYSNFLSISIPHSLDCDLNLRTLKVNAFRNETYYTIETRHLKLAETWLLKITNFYSRFADYETQT